MLTEMGGCTIAKIRSSLHSSCGAAAASHCNTCNIFKAIILCMGIEKGTGVVESVAGVIANIWWPFELQIVIFQALKFKL